MSHSELRITQAESGGPLRGRGISCHAGQITVFRSFTDSGLRPVQQLFSPTAGGVAIFTATLDGEPFSPAMHLVIGFGPDFSDPTLKIWEYLRDAGVPAEHVPHLLETYNFPHSDGACTELPSNQARMLRIIGASYNSDKVLVLNDPFAPLSTEWRERMAEYIAVQAKSMRQIVIVTSLSARPQCWIGNELISRVQIEEQFNMTIGHGGVAEMNELIKQARTSVAARTSTASAFVTSAQHLTAIDHEPEGLPSRLDAAIDWVQKGLIGDRRWQPFHTAALAVAVACCFFVLQIWSSFTERPTEALRARASTEPPAGPPSPTVNEIPVSPPPPTAPQEANLPPVVVARTGPLDSYPQDIKKAVLDSLNDIFPASPVPVSEPPIQRAVQYQPATTTYPDPQTEEEGRNEEINAEAITSYSEQEWEARRSAMREHFLAAVRAAEEQQEPQ
jgi:hypothetical protein